MDYKNTLNLPKTDFPMKANLSCKEPEMLKMWEEMNIYEKIREASKGKELYILHDGPPYANGNIHLGTALNKIIKDMIIKAKNMSGFDSIFVPGWDCHGLPIEHQVEKELGAAQHQMSQADKRRFCRAFAEKYVGIQREQFKRLGVFGEWENPYLTMDYKYEAETVKEFCKLLFNGNVYRGKKPVYWCASCKTALAEAEVEYKNHHTPSIYVKFPLISDIADFLPKLAGEKNVSVVIWTTTPWTIPPNQAVALHGEHTYVAVKIGDETLILAKQLLATCMDLFGYKQFKVLDEFSGATLEGLKCKHPFLNRESLIIVASFVTLDTGTGCVHIAPGHGQEDYEIGMEYGLENYAPVDDDGRYTSDVDFFAGQFVFDANESVIKKIKEVGALLNRAEIEHSYPHCWRCKSPIIFRSTEQWFISMEKNNLRENALKAIDTVRWIPEWGRDRIYGMVKHRPDWCISRQRLWGVPITIFYCNGCKKELMTEEIRDFVVDLIAAHGADVWFEKEPKELLPPQTLCPDCGGSSFEKETDILDVWFDSGVSHAAVLEQRSYLRSPADMYLEGSDQHRGWFHSSLLESVGTRGNAPYKSVLTHGFVVDGEGKKMSKSVGNVIDSQEIIDQHGAEILRLWVAAEDYTQDIRISSEIISRLVESYRRIRNTGRYILGNIHDFDCDADMVAYQDMEEIDKWALHRTQEIIQRVREAYDQYQFHIAFFTLHNFCTVDLSSLYLDVLKDRLYTSKAKSQKRRSAQSAMFIILDSMTRLLAPILTFTAEEIWLSLPSPASGKAASVHLTQFPSVNNNYLDEKLAEKWKTMIAIRADALKAIEIARQKKIIGHSLDACVSISPPKKLLSFLESHVEDMRALMIVSKVSVVDEGSFDDPYASPSFEGLTIGVSKAPGKKCGRCWIFNEKFSELSSGVEICERCLANLE